MRGVQLQLPSEDTIDLTVRDAQRVIESLWAVSTVPGAVATVGKIRHALRNGGDAVIGDSKEADALQAALADAQSLTPALEKLRDAARRSR